MIEGKIRKDPSPVLIASILRLAGGQAQLYEHQVRQWASATFTGLRHKLILDCEGAEPVQAGEALVNQLPEHEFALSGHIVADIAVTERCQRDQGQPSLRLVIEALTVEDC